MLWAPEIGSDESYFRRNHEHLFNYFTLFGIEFFESVVAKLSKEVKVSKLLTVFLRFWIVLSHLALSVT